jgi:L-threonylcarbamoyladenylate synthase
VIKSQFLASFTSPSINSVAEHLMDGDLVAFPTETVYGLGADACNATAVARIYEVKGRPADHPLIVHIASISSMAQWALEVPKYAIDLAVQYWPGPMTLVLKRSKLAGDFITGGQKTVGVRIPDHAAALALLKAFELLGGKGIAAPSANRFGHVSPTSAAAVVGELGEFLRSTDVVLDGGECVIGVESTIIDCTGEQPKILRPGAVTAAMIQECTRLEVAKTISEIRVSGSLDSHYAPNARVILDQVAKRGQGLLALIEIPTPEGVIRLAEPKNTQEFAQVLYASLRKADLQSLTEIVVIQPSGNDIAVAIRDRLKKAANHQELS